MTYYVSNLSRSLANGTISARQHVEDCLAAIDCEDGNRAFISVHKQAACDAADLVDTARANGYHLPPFAGVTLSVKDLFDHAGSVTMAGSTVLKDVAPAQRDALVLARLRALGFIVIGRTNMTEFAFSGLGMNPHYGNPRSPFERQLDGGRIAGGSSSGSAVSISDGMAAATIGSDTGGSTRAPAAFCGIVGFKATATRMPLDGIFPLSTSFDAAGPMTNSAECTAIMDDIMAGGDGKAETPFPLRGLRIAIPKGYLFDDLDPEVANAFDAAIDRLSHAGASIVDITIDILEELRPANTPKSIVAAEAYQVHRDRINDTRRKDYDPYVAARIDGGRDILASDYIDLLAARETTMRAVQNITRPYDVLALPTSPTIPPKLVDLEGIDELGAASARVLRNTALSNYLDRPTITIPCHAYGTAPVGFSLMGSRHHDRRLLAIATAAESIIRG